MVDLNYEEKEAKPSSRLDHVLSLLEFLFGTFAHSHEKNGALAFRVRREEPDYLVVIKSQAGSAQVLGVGREIQLASQNAGFELHRAVSTIPEALQNRSQVYQEKYVHGGVRGQLLVQSEVTGLGAKVSRLQKPKHAAITIEDIGSRFQTFHCVDNQVQLIELSSRWIEEICGDAAGCSVEHGGELRQTDRRSGKLAGRTTSQDDLLDRVVRHLGIRERLELSDLPGRWRKPGQRRAAAPPVDLLGRMQGRGSVDFAHQRIVNLTPRGRDRFWPKRGDFTGRLRRESRDVAKGHERKGHLALRINIQQAIDLRILEAAHDLCRQSQGRRNREKIGQHSAVVPAEMAIGTRLIFPSIAPIDAGAGDNYRCVSNGGLSRGRFN